MIARKRACIIAALLYLTVTLSAQNPTAQAARLALQSPHDAMWVHLFYLQPDSYRPDLSATAMPTSLDSVERVNAAVKLKQVLDGRGLFVHMNLLPTEADYIDTITQKFFFTPFPDDLPEIFLERDGTSWRYAQASAAVIAVLHKKVYPFGIDRLIGLFSGSTQRRVLGLSAWQYVGILGVLVFALLAHLILRQLFQFLARILSSRRIHSLSKFSSLNKRLAQSISLLVLILVLRMFVPVLQLPILLGKYMIAGLEIIATVFLVIVVLRLIDIIIAYLSEMTTRTESKMDDQLIPLLNRILQITVIIAGFIQILRILDVNIAAIVAGISLGGLALALAAQDTVKNLIGSVMILTDKPFQIGDWVEGADFVGTVVEVGFRTTRIQQSDTSIISVPNGNMANASVTNKGVRVMRMFEMNLGITYDTPPDLIEMFMEGIKEIIRTYPRLAHDNYFVHLTDLKDFSLNIFVRAYMQVATYADELELKQALILSIMRWAETLGVRFAFPTNTVQIEEMPGQISLIPHVDSDPNLMNEKLQSFIKTLREQMPANEDTKEIDKA